MSKRKSLAQQREEIAQQVDEPARRLARGLKKEEKRRRTRMNIPAPTMCDEVCKQEGGAGYFRHYRRGEEACEDAKANWAIRVNKNRKKGKNSQ